MAEAIQHALPILPPPIGRRGLTTRTPRTPQHGRHFLSLCRSTSLQFPEKQKPQEYTLQTSWLIEGDKKLGNMMAFRANN
uniref:Uncharacterized protein n=1 Tax=Leersia perrieri TaxID=77586 RepID=A0A0D9WZQ9_9ORYZ